jgi:hypothetical protein
MARKMKAEAEFHDALQERLIDACTAGREAAVSAET